MSWKYKKKERKIFMTIYDELLLRVEEGEKFDINFEKRNMKVGKTWLIKDGECEISRILYGKHPVSIKDEIESLYKSFKYSCPSERSDSKRKGYFKALSVDELTDEQMVYGENRELMQAQLEGFILCAILMNHLKWEDLTDQKWFWQSDREKDLIILKSWIEGK